MTHDEPAEATASERYHDFMLGLYDMLCAAVEGGYDEEAIAYLSKARRFFMKEFRERHPERAARTEGTRAVWPDP